jgi:DNA-binding transcriptional MocR family regulator
MAKTRELGSPAAPKVGQWAQVDRAATEAWGLLMVKKPRAAQLLAVLVARMGHQNALVASQSTLAALMGCSVDTTQRAITELKLRDWIQVVKLGKGKEAAYVVNSRVAWAQSRDQLCLSVFSATVIADVADQDEADTARLETPLRRIPTLYPGERQLPVGPGAEPPSQPSLEGLEPDLPAIRIVPETGEIL